MTRDELRFSDDERLLSFELLGLGAFMLLSFLVPGVPGSTIFALLAVVLVLAAQRAARWEPTDRSAGRVAIIGIAAGAILVMVSVYGHALTPGSVWPNTTVTALVVAAIAGLGTAVFKFGASQRFRLLAAFVIVGIIVAIGALYIHDDWEAIDVLDLHRSAAEVLANGENPYVAARALNTSPLAPDGAEFVGYVYPPTVLMAFVLGDWAFGDPRWASVSAVGILVLLLVAPWRRLSRSIGTARVALALLVVAQPFLGFVINRGWTDLIALPFLLGSGLLWRRHPYVSAVLLGLALSTKGYFVLALPLLLLWPDEHRWRRIAIVCASVAMTYLPFVIADPASTIRSIQGAALSAPYRPDSLGLAGLGVNVPRFLSLGLSVGTGIWIGIRGGRPERFFLGLAAVLAVAFITGFQTFINYWFLVAGLVVVAVAVRSSPESGEDDPATTSGRLNRSNTNSATD